MTSDGNYSTQSGRIRIHQEVDGSWTYRQQHTGSGNTYFGEHAIAVNGDGSVIAVGAYYENSQRGYVDIFRQATDTTWTRTQNNLAASNGAGSDYFGWSVSLNRTGDRLAVGARHEDGGAPMSLIKVRFIFLITMAAVGMKPRYCVPVMPPRVMILVSGSS